MTMMFQSLRRKLKSKSNNPAPVDLLQIDELVKLAERGNKDSLYKYVNELIMTTSFFHPGNLELLQSYYSKYKTSDSTRIKIQESILDNIYSIIRQY